MSVGEEVLDVVVLGTGPIGLAYGHRLAEAGHRVTWGSDATHRSGAPVRLLLHDCGSGERWGHRATTRDLADLAHADLVLVALGAHAWPQALPAAARLPGEPAIVTLGQNPLGWRAVPEALRPRTILAFPGLTGRLAGDEVEYVRLVDQPTTVLRGEVPLQKVFTLSLSREAFTCQGVDDDGWFAYRALQSVTMATAIVRAGGEPAALAADRQAVRLLWDAVREGVAALRAAGVRGLSPADVVGYHPLAGPYWRSQTAGQLRLESADQAFGVYARGMGSERAWLTAWALAVCDEAPTPTGRLRELLEGF